MIGTSFRLTSSVRPLKIEGYVRMKKVLFYEKGGMWTFTIGSDEGDDGLLDEGECPEDLSPITAMGLMKTLIRVHMGVNLHHIPSRELLAL